MAKRKKPKAPVTAKVVDDPLGPTPERRRQYGDKPARFQTDTGRVIERLSVVDSLFENDEIGPDGFLAAANYLADYDAGFGTRTTSNLSNDVVDGSGSADHLNAKRLDAARRFTEASQSMRGEYRHALKHMVLDDLSMTQYAIQHLGYHQGHKSASAKAKQRLVRAINALARFYAPVTAPARPRTRAHMEAGARPTIHPFQTEDAA